MNEKACKRPLAKCLGFLATLKSKNGWPNDDLWNLADVFKDDTNALVKVSLSAAVDLARALEGERARACPLVWSD